MSTNNFTKGILLAGGRGSRLGPLTRAINKQLLPIYDKPLIYYSLATLMLAGIRDVLLITAPGDQDRFGCLFGDGLRLGISLQYVTQEHPRGIAESLILGSNFVGQSHVTLALGDNLFLGGNIADYLARATFHDQGATILVTEVDDPRPFGVLELDSEGAPRAISEKPSTPRSNLAIPGIYFYDNSVLEIAKDLQPSARGELEITDVNRCYLERGQLHVERLDNDIRWLDTGTPQTMSEATNLVRHLESSLGQKVGCIEEIAFRQGWISAEVLAQQAETFGGEYGDYLRQVAESAAPAAQAGSFTASRGRIQ